MELVNNLGYSFGLESQLSSSIISLIIERGGAKVPVCNSNFILKKWDFSTKKWVESFVETTSNTLEYEKLKQKETDLYLKRIQDAQRIWAGLSAEFRIAKQIGKMDDSTENIILAELKPVLDIIVPFGQWKTGYQLLLQVDASIIGQELYDKLHNIIYNYIKDNY